MNSKPTLTKFADARVNHAFGHTLHFHLRNPTVTSFTDSVPPGGGPPLHFHVDEDEWWYVLEGELEYFDGQTWTRVAPGGVVFSPKNSDHCFRNPGRTPARHLTFTMPGGFEKFFQCCHNATAAGTFSPQLVGEIGARHGIYFHTLAGVKAPPHPKPTLPSLIVPADKGRSLHAFGDEVIVMLDGAQTGGNFTSFVDVTPPGGGPPPHWHEREDEWFHVLEGRVSFYDGHQWHDALPGDSVFAPRGKVHTFKNNSGMSTRMLVHTSPSGFETFYAEAAAEFARRDGPDMQRAVAIAGKYGIRFA